MIPGLPSNNKTETLKADAVTLYFAIRDPRTTPLARLVALGVVAYALSPVDVLPDFVPFIGWIDDFIIMGLGMKLVRYLIPQQVWEESKTKAGPVEDKIKRWYKKVIWILVGVWAILIILSAIVVALIVWLVVSLIK